ncbi:MAG: hypothetical protein SF339_29605 [Blastocatellia bacterium]|nr:hypothetical protein [Blastocatellia bacterium]
MNRRAGAKASGLRDSRFILLSTIALAAESVRCGVLPAAAGINPTEKAAKRIYIAGGES